MAKKENRIWFCENCHRVGLITINDDTWDHFCEFDKSHRSVSPDCIHPEVGTRIVIKDHELLIGSLPVWAQEPIRKLLQSSTQ